MQAQAACRSGAAAAPVLTHDRHEAAVAKAHQCIPDGDDLQACKGWVKFRRCERQAGRSQEINP